MAITSILVDIDCNDLQFLYKAGFVLGHVNIYSDFIFVGL